PGTRTGLSRPVVVPSPSWPRELSPQAQTLPSPARASVCALPAATRPTTTASPGAGAPCAGSARETSAEAPASPAMRKPVHTNAAEGRRRLLEGDVILRPPGQSRRHTSAGAPTPSSYRPSIWRETVFALGPHPAGGRLSLANEREASRGRERLSIEDVARTQNPVHRTCVPYLRCSFPHQITAPSGTTAFFGITTIPSRMK